MGCGCGGRSYTRTRSPIVAPTTQAHQPALRPPTPMRTASYTDLQRPQTQPTLRTTYQAPMQPTLRRQV